MKMIASEDLLIDHWSYEAGVTIKDLDLLRTLTRFSRSLYSRLKLCLPLKNAVLLERRHACLGIHVTVESNNFNTNACLKIQRRITFANKNNLTMSRQLSNKVLSRRNHTFWVFPLARSDILVQKRGRWQYRMRYSREMFCGRLMGLCAYRRW